MAGIEYELIRSKRKTLQIGISGGKVTVRAPLKTAKKDIDAFVAKYEAKIRQILAADAEKEQKAKQEGVLSDDDIKALTAKAKACLPQRAEYFARQMGVTYGKITVRCQKTRWGSCSSEGNLNFNCLLMLTPPEVIDSVVIHELCHRKEMNHSKKFYDELYRFCPEYDKRRQWLKKNGGVILARRR